MKLDILNLQYQPVELLGRLALFTGSRISRASLPEGWYRYDVRGSDDDFGAIATLEHTVLVNYVGSFLTNYPIVFPEGEEYIDIMGKIGFLDDDESDAFLEEFYAARNNM